MNTKINMKTPVHHFKLICFLLIFISVVCSSVALAQLPDGLIRVSPEPGSQYNSVERSISLRFAHSLVEIQEAESGIVIKSGNIKIPFIVKIAGSNHEILLITPGIPFPFNSLIDVEIPAMILKDEKKIPGFCFQFTTASKTEKNRLNTLMKEKPNQLIQEMDFKTATLPKRTIETDLNDQVPFAMTKPSGNRNDYYFLSSMFSSGAKDRLAIINGMGEWVFDRRMPFIPIDFKMFYDSTFAFASMGNGPENWFYVILNRQFQPIDTIWAGNGLALDFHELLKDPNTGNYYLLAQRQITVDMSKLLLGGKSNAIVLDMVIQEIDANGNVLFEWNCFDHLPIMDAFGVDLTSPGPIDYIHSNSLFLDTDTSILLCSRHFNEITRIDRRSGSIIWRLGNRASTQSFQFINDPGAFTYQHSVERLANGNILLFDNGNLKPGPRSSRVVEYKIDESLRIAEKVWEYQHPNEVAADFMGSVQRLENGNTLIGWGSANPNFTEIDTLNNIVCEGSFPDRVMSYRVKKYTIPGLILPNQPTFDAPPTLSACRLNDPAFQTEFFKSLGAYIQPEIGEDFRKYQLLGNNLKLVLEDTTNNFYSFHEVLVDLKKVKLNRRDTILCDGNKLFNIKVLDDCEASTYQWNTGEKDQEINYKPTPLQNKVWVTTRNGDLSQTDTLRLQVSAVEPFEIIGENSVTKPFQILTYSAPWYKSARYDWKVINGNLISGYETNAVQVQWGNKPESYLISTIVDDYGCSLTGKTDTIMLVINSTGLENLFQKTGVQVFPMPFSSKLTMQSENEFRFKLITTGGKEIYRSEGLTKGYEIPTEELAAGIYLLEVETGKEIHRVKVLKTQ